MSSERVCACRCENDSSMKKTLRLLSVLAALGFSSGASLAQVLMLDFGPTPVSGSNQINSPYHTAVPSFSGSNWNQIQVTDVTSGLLYGDGSATSGLNLNIGATTTATTSSSTFVLTNAPSGNTALGTLTNTGVYAGTSVGTDGIFTSSAGNARAVGFQLTGLAAGTYDVYVTARNTSSNANYTQTAFVGTSAVGNFALNGAGMTAETLSFASAATATSSWIEDANYLKFTVTLTAGSGLNVATLGGGGEVRGFLNSVQIVAVPEPAIPVMLGVAAVLFGFRRRTGRAGFLS